MSFRNPDAPEEPERDDSLINGVERLDFSNGVMSRHILRADTMRQIRELEVRLADVEAQNEALRISNAHLERQKDLDASNRKEDIIARNATESRQLLLMAELDHRVKNTLSIVLSIAKQTLRTTADFKTFRDAFEGRLMALAQVHRLLTKNRWAAVLLEDLINLAAKPYIDSNGPYSEISGPPVRLGPKDAQSIHLIFHELATNAAKYGAFSVPNGRVTVNWALAPTSEGTNVHIRWIESGGPQVTTPAQRGFGHELIERIVIDGLSGKLTLEYLPDGFQWSAEFPLPDASLTLPLDTPIAEWRLDIAPK